MFLANRSEQSPHLVPAGIFSRNIFLRLSEVTHPTDQTGNVKTGSLWTAKLRLVHRHHQQSWPALSHHTSGPRGRHYCPRASADRSNGPSGGSDWLVSQVHNSTVLCFRGSYWKLAGVKKKERKLEGQTCWHVKWPSAWGTSLKREVLTWERTVLQLKSLAWHHIVRESTN